MIIDTHCHFDMMPQPEAYIRESEAKGNIVIGMTNLPFHFAIGAPHVRGFKRIRLALGLHPLLAAENSKETAEFKNYVDQTSYIGEIGLDFSREGMATKDDQISVLREILATLRGKKKIISVHSRRAERELLDLLIEYDIENVVFHWYTGPIELIPAILERGYYFSVNEAMCQSKNGRAILDRIPSDRILTETDAPFNKKCDIHNLLKAIGVEEININQNFNNLLGRLRR